jgi:hypothetical protein
LFIINEELEDIISEEEKESSRNMDRISDSPTNWIPVIPRRDIFATEYDNVNKLIIKNGMSMVDLMGNDDAFERYAHERLNDQRSLLKVKSPKEYDWMMDEDRV